MWIFRKKEERGRAKNKKRGKKVKYRTNSKKIVGKNDFGLRKIWIIRGEGKNNIDVKYSPLNKWLRMHHMSKKIKFNHSGLNKT